MSTRDWIIFFLTMSLGLSIAALISTIKTQQKIIKELNAEISISDSSSCPSATIIEYPIEVKYPDRYFFFTYYAKANGQGWYVGNQNCITRGIFPIGSGLKDIVAKKTGVKNTDNIVILNIQELSEQDYNNFNK